MESHKRRKLGIWVVRPPTWSEDWIEEVSSPWGGPFLETMFMDREDQTAVQVKSTKGEGSDSGAICTKGLVWPQSWRISICLWTPIQRIGSSTPGRLLLAHGQPNWQTDRVNRGGHCFGHFLDRGAFQRWTTAWQRVRRKELRMVDPSILYIKNIHWPDKSCAAHFIESIIYC